MTRELSDDEMAGELLTRDRTIVIKRAHLHPEVKAEVAKALAEYERDETIQRATGGRYVMSTWLETLNHRRRVHNPHFEVFNKISTHGLVAKKHQAKYRLLPSLRTLEETHSGVDLKQNGDIHIYEREQE